MHQNLTVSVVAPVYNEEAVILAFLTKTEAILKHHFANYEIILIDDGSTDNTLALCKSYREKSKKVRIIVFSRNYGHEIALTAGIEHARGDVVVQLDSDLQHPPEVIPELVNKLLTGYDIVYAARINKHHTSALKALTSRWFYKISRRLTGINIIEDAGNFRAITRRVVESIIQFQESNRHLLMIYAYVGFKSASIPYECEPRFAGESKYNYRKLINLALDSIISFSHRPLRYMAAFSILISIIMCFLAGFTFLQKLFNEGVLSSGVSFIIFMTSLLFSILFLFLGVISEYIGRILIESKNRPLYHIKEEY